MRRFLTGLVIALVLLARGNALAQGVQTGTLTGTVKSADGLTLPGATVTVKSPALQGERSAVTDVNGVYIVRGLPPGMYTVTVTMSGFETVTTPDVDVTIGGTAMVDATLRVAGHAETVTVTAESPSPLTTVTVGQTLTKREVDALPVGRTPAQIAELSPGLNNNTPNNGQVSISGGFSYDNVFFVNGVDVNDNLFGTAHGLYIEDAVQETRVLTSGISAEYGRFSGGVINIITKSGGNTFTGSFRENLTNPSWIGETPRERSADIDHVDKVGMVHEGTFGGPLQRDKLWFFSAGRYEKTDIPSTFSQSTVGYTRTDTVKRGELKFTGTPVANHTIQGSYINNNTEQANASGLSATLLMDPSVLVNRNQPSHLFAVNYNGVLGSRYFASLQYSEKKFGFRNTGGTSTDILDSPFRSRGVAGVPANLLYAAPFFSANDPEDRNNRQFSGSLAYTLSTRRGGSHDLKGGGEYFVSTRTGGNSQSSTNYVFQSDYKIDAAGQPVLDADGIPIPRFVPGTSRVQNWLPTVGARVDIKTTSFYLQDRWVASPRLTLDLGTRFEFVRSEATGDITTVDTNAIVPRLGATYDLMGDGHTVLQGTYAHYAGKYSEAQFASNTDVGNPSRITYGYTGPGGEGRSFAPGFDLANYGTVISGSFPTANIFVEHGLSSPVIKEATASIGHQIGQRGFAKATYVWRTTDNFVDDVITFDQGKTTVIRNGVNFGTFDNVVYRNIETPTRDYQALILQSNYQIGAPLTVAGHYTLQLRDNGNFEGEAANQPASASIIGDYPEIYDLSRYAPEGRLNTYQRHKMRLWAIYNQGLGRFGALDIVPLWRVNSGQAYSLFAAAVPLSSVQLARNPGYANITSLTANNLYFGERGSETFKGYGVLDFSATYSIPVWKTARPWIKVEIYNVFNNDKQIAWDRTITPDPNSPKDANGQATGFIQAATFGTATQDNHYIQPYPGQNGLRAFRMAMGVRF